MPYPSKTDRHSIVQAAMDRVSQDGLAGLSLRGLASSLGIAPNALYRYFADRAALEAALAEESQQLLLTALRKAAGKKSPAEAVPSIARAYLRFARDWPHVFALTLLRCAEESGDDAAHIHLWNFVVAQVAALYGEKQAPEAAVTLWAFLHGMTALEAAGVFGKRKPLSSFEFGLNLWLQAATYNAD